jgi:hypothetical protein
VQTDSSSGRDLLPGDEVPDRWFATATFWEDRDVRGSTLSRPASLVHAKRMGTIVTACGLPTTSWRKFYDLPFPVATGDNCPACRDATERSRRSGH